MITIPPVILDSMQLRVGATVDLSVTGDRLLVRPQKKPRYTLDELLDQCDPKASVTREGRAWLNAPKTGREL